MPTDREIRLYYFTTWDACQMVKVSDTYIKNAIRTKGIVAVKYNGQWMIQPDQISILKYMAKRRKAA